VTGTLEPACSPAARPAAREVVERLWQLYAHDLSAFRGTRPDAHGRFRPGRLPGYFDEPDREVHLVALDGGPVGFTMVRRLDHAGHVLGADAREERRPVPGKPEVPPDSWLVLDLRGPARPPRRSRASGCR
jgi:hypothetical protein